MAEADDALRSEEDTPAGPAGSRNGELRSVAGYRLLRRIGEGGMSTVYLSYDVPGRRAVAVKLLADHLAGQREFVSRFYREARLSRLQHHPNIVQGFAAGYDPGANKHYLVLEFIDGPSAHTALTQFGRLPTGVAVRIGIDIARALDFLHRRNYVHRDVKPDNILLHPDGGAKLADLGLTKRLTDDTHLTSVNLGVGTSYYMPYEQAMNAALVDGRSDIFALGATLYHLLSGQVPFPGATHEEIIREKEHNAFVALRQLNPEVPETLERIIAATLARDPRSRYQDAGELADALEATGLATRIPTFASADQTGPPPGGDSPPVDAPTRADLPGPLGVIQPDAGFVALPHPAPAGVPIPVVAVSTPTPTPTPRFAPLVITGILLAIGVAGVLSRPTATPPSGNRQTAIHDRPAASPAGLNRTDSQ